jgi:hypothetical protein
VGNHIRDNGFDNMLSTARAGHMNVRDTLAQVDRCTFRTTLADDRINSPKDDTRFAWFGGYSFDTIRELSRRLSGISFLDSTFLGGPKGERLVSNANKPTDWSLLIRRCKLYNMTISREDVRPENVGIVDSVIEPALDTGLGIVGPPDCGVAIGDKVVCDPRAACSLKEGGGVSCSCEAVKGLSARLGARDDGSACIMQPQVRAIVSSRVVRLEVSKPGTYGERITLQLSADGDTNFNSTVHIDTKLFSPNGTQLGRVSSGAPAFGERIQWTPALPQSEEWLLDGAGSNVTATSRAYQLGIVIACDGSTLCPRDGDMIQTTVAVSAEGGSADSVVVNVHVKALPSCQGTLAALSSNQTSFNHNADSLTLLVFMHDVDRLPIEYSEPALAVSWGPDAGNRDVVLYQRSELGAHVFQAAVPQELRSNAGRFLLSATVNQGWDDQKAGQSDCTVAEFPIVIRCSDGYEEAGPARRCIRVMKETRQPLPEILVPIFAAALLLLVGLRCWYLRSEITAARRLADARAKTLARLRVRWASGKGTLDSLDEANEFGDLPIHCAAAGFVPLGLLNELIHGYPKGASLPDRLGNLPLHLMVRSLGTSKQPVESVYPAFEALLRAYPKATIIPGEDFKLPIELLLQRPYTLPDRSRLEVLLGFPHNVEGLADNWLGLLQHPTENEDGERAVEAIVQEAKRNRGVTIEQLASATDSSGREAYAIATKSKRRCLNKHLLLLGRFASRPLSAAISGFAPRFAVQVPSSSACASEPDCSGHSCVG